MKKRLIRLISYAAVVAASSQALAGCGFIPTLELTDEQSSLIAEYAAGKLLEYAKGHPGGLMILEDVDRAEVNPGLQKEEEMLPPQMPEEFPEMQEDIPQADVPDFSEFESPDEPVIEGPEQDAIVEAPADDMSVPSKPLAEALGVAGADIAYDHYEITDMYPDDPSKLAFTMKAAEGKDLLIVHFALSNLGDSDVDVYTDSSNFKVRMMINGSEKIRGDVTFLDNDLMNYRGVISPGAAVDSVLVFEVKKGTEISSMDLLIVEDDGEQRYTLF